MRVSVPGSPEGGATAHRLAAARRQARKLRLRRLVPGIVVGTTTLAGTGSLVAWVSNQPGLKATAASQTAAPAPTGATPSTDPAVLSAVQRQLQQEEVALEALQSRMAELARRAASERAAAASTGGQVSGWSQGPGARAAQGAATPGAPPVVAAGSVPPLPPQPTLPPMPSLSAPAPAATAAAPAATATTGASHALP